MAPPAVPRPGRRPRHRILLLLVGAVVVASAGFGAVSLAGSAGWTLPGGGVAAVASPVPTTPLGPSRTSSPSPSVSLSPTPAVLPSASAGSGLSSPSAPPGSAAPSPPLAVALQPQLQARLDLDRRRLGLPGVSVTILFSDGSSWTGASGAADVEGGIPVTADTAFALGSISKTYTAALIVALAGDGRIDLDAPARTYLPAAKLDQRITVRMLLDHTSGLDDFFLHPPIDKALLGRPDATWSAARSLRYVGKRYFVPGRGWHYSNTNYLYLGLIAEQVTGTNLATALRQRFFTPLHLTATWYQAVDPPRTALAHGYRFTSPSPKAPPIDLADGTGVAPFRSVVTAAGGAGSIAATSADVAQWGRLLFGGTALGPTQTALMVGDIATTARYKPRVPYGLGVQVFPIDGRLSYGHSGRLLGFRALVRHMPIDGTTIAVLTNQSRTDPAIVAEHLLRIVFAPTSACPPCSTTK